MCPLANAGTSLSRLRILLAHHAPLDHDPPGQQVRRLYDELRTDGHQVRLLTLGQSRQVTNNDERRVICAPGPSEADLAFALPRFVAGANDATSTSFDRLTNQEWHDYRDVLRQAFDTEVDHFDPHIVHTQHAWLLAHLALEAGVPYAVSVWSEELETVAKDARFSRIAHEAAENAGRLMTTDVTTGLRAAAAFAEVDADRFVVLRDANHLRLVKQVEDVYYAVLTNRFGGTIRP